MTIDFPGFVFNEKIDSVQTARGIEAGRLNFFIRDTHIQYNTKHNLQIQECYLVLIHLTFFKQKRLKQLEMSSLSLARQRWMSQMAN